MGRRAIRSPLIVFNMLSGAMAAMSIILIIDYIVYGGNWNSLLGEIILYWDSFVSDLFTYIIPIEPFIEYIISLININFGFNLELQPHWRHIFVLWVLIFGAEVSVGLSNPDTRSAAYRVGLVGICFGLAASLSVGLVPLTSDAFIAHLVIGAVPATLFWASAPVGLAVIGRFKRIHLDNAILKILITNSIIVLTLSMALLNGGLQNIIHFGILIFFCFVAYDTIDDFSLAIRRRISSFKRPLRKSYGFIGASVFVLANVGLNLSETITRL